MPWNVFVLGRDELGERLLPQLSHADDYAFHSLLPLEEAVHAAEYDISRLMDDATGELERFPGPVDAVVTYWDFPASALAPLLRSRFGLHGPSLEAVLKCEHKYWSRVEQARAIPDCVPSFQALDPFAEDPLSQVELPYPFWLKPVKAHSSQLGFRIEDPQALLRVLPLIRDRIGRFGRPFMQVAAHAEIPEEIAAVTGHHCIAEGIISSGRQYTLEGYVLNGEVHVYGVIDTVRDRQYRSVLSRYTYPSHLPASVQERMVGCTKGIMERIGYEEAPFNIEFYYDRRNDRTWLLEINSRLSRSHAALFLLVDGAPHFQVMTDVALGIPPRMPQGQGRYAVAAKHMMRVFHDGIVRRVPSEEEIRRVEEVLPGTIVELNVSEGTRLADLLHQDPYSYLVAEIFIGAENERRLRERIQLCETMLPFTIDPVDTRSTA